MKKAKLCNLYALFNRPDWLQRLAQFEKWSSICPIQTKYMEHDMALKTAVFTKDYFAIVSMGQFLMKGEIKFFHDLAHAQLFNSRAEAGAFMREWKISGSVVRVTCEFTAHGV